MIEKLFPNILIEYSKYISVCFLCDSVILELFMLMPRLLPVTKAWFWNIYPLLQVLYFSLVFIHSALGLQFVGYCCNTPTFKTNHTAICSLIFVLTYLLNSIMLIKVWIFLDQNVFFRFPNHEFFTTSEFPPIVVREKTKTNIHGAWMHYLHII